MQLVMINHPVNELFIQYRIIITEYAANWNDWEIERSVSSSIVVTMHHQCSQFIIYDWFKSNYVIGSLDFPNY